MMLICCGFWTMLTLTFNFFFKKNFLIWKNKIQTIIITYYLNLIIFKSNYHEWMNELDDNNIGNNKNLANPGYLLYFFLYNVFHCWCFVTEDLNRKQKKTKRNCTCKQLRAFSHHIYFKQFFFLLKMFFHFRIPTCIFVFWYVFSYKING